MPLVIPTNVASLDAQKTLTRNSNALAKSFARLSSGFRINTAADDAITTLSTPLARAYSSTCMVPP